MRTLLTTSALTLVLGLGTQAVAQDQAAGAYDGDGLTTTPGGDTRGAVLLAPNSQGDPSDPELGADTAPLAVLRDREGNHYVIENGNELRRLTDQEMATRGLEPYRGGAQLGAAPETVEPAAGTPGTANVNRNVSVEEDGDVELDVSLDGAPNAIDHSEGNPVPAGPGSDSYSAAQVERGGGPDYQVQDADRVPKFDENNPVYDE